LLAPVPLPRNRSNAATAAHEGDISEQVPRNAVGSGARTQRENRRSEPPSASPTVARIMAMRWREALRFIEGAWRRSDEPDSAAHTAAIQVCGRYSQAEAAVRLLSRMHSRRVRPDRAAYLALLGACARARKWNWALAALREMKMLDVQPGASGYRLTIQACSFAESDNRVEDLVVEMRKQELELDLETYKCMVQGYLEQDRYGAVKQLVFDMQDAGIQPDVETYSSAMRACGRSGDWPAALIFLEAVRWEDAGDDALFACVPVIDACARSASWEFALLVLDQVQPAIANQPKGVATDAYVLAAASRACMAGQQPELAEQFEEQRQAALDRAKAEVISDTFLTDRKRPTLAMETRRPLSSEAMESLDWGLDGTPWTQESERSRARKR